MPFFKFPLMLVLFLVLFSGGRVLPFLLVALGLFMMLRIAGQMSRYEPQPTVSVDQLGDLRTDVAVTLLDLDNDDRVKTNPDIRSRVRTASSYYAQASAAVDRGVRRRDRDDVARALHRASYELEAASAELDGRSAPDPPDELRTSQRVAVASRPQARRHYRVGCRW